MVKGKRQAASASSSNKLCYQRLQKELRSIVQNPDCIQGMRCAVNPADMLEWEYLLIGAEDTVYRGGVYHGRIRFPKGATLDACPPLLSCLDVVQGRLTRSWRSISTSAEEYPFKPPSIMMTTPNGRFKTNTRLCLSISDYHPETWNPLWSVSTILLGISSFFYEDTHTAGALQGVSDDEKRQLAASSFEYNMNKNTGPKNFKVNFRDFIDAYREDQAVNETPHREEGVAKATSDGRGTAEGALAPQAPAAPFWTFSLGLLCAAVVFFAIAVNVIAR